MLYLIFFLFQILDSFTLWKNLQKFDNLTDRSAERGWNDLILKAQNAIHFYFKTRQVKEENSLNANL